MALLIDRLQVLFDRPSSIGQHQGHSVTSEVTPDALREFLEATREAGGPPSHASPMPRAPRRLDD